MRERDFGACPALAGFGTWTSRWRKPDVTEQKMGFDSRAYRISGVDQARVFEVDLPSVQRLKQERLERVLGALPAHVTLIPVDFDRAELEEAMAAAGLRSGVKTFYIWEGVTQYITAEAVDTTFRYVCRVAGEGSEIVFTYIQRGIVDGSQRSQVDERIVAFAQRVGAPWIFGIDPAEIQEYLAARGLELIEEVGASEYRARYLEPLGRRMDIFEGERVALARIVGLSAA